MTHYRMEVRERVPGRESRYVAVHDGLTGDEMREHEARHLARGRLVDVIASPGGSVLGQLVFPGFGAGVYEGGHNGRTPAAADVHESLHGLPKPLLVAGGV